MGCWFRKLVDDRHGATAIEYGLIAALIVIVATVGIRAVGASNGGGWGNVADRVAAVEPIA